MYQGAPFDQFTFRDLEQFQHFGAECEPAVTFLMVPDKCSWPYVLKWWTRASPICYT